MTLYAIKKLRRSGKLRRVEVTREDVRNFRKSLESATEESYEEFGRAKPACWAAARYYILD